MSPLEIMTQILRMVGTVEFFPSDEATIANIASAVLMFDPKPEPLAEAVDKQIQYVGTWRGIAPFKALYLDCKQPMVALGPAYEIWEPPKQIAEPVDPEKELEIQEYSAKLKRNIAIAAARKKFRDEFPHEKYNPPDWLQ